MSAADILHDPTGAPARPRRAPAAPDYHALGTFSETWAFLELFLDRCAAVVGVGEASEDPPSLKARLDRLDAAARLLPALEGVAAEVAGLTAEVRVLAFKRRIALENIARASLERLGMNLFELPTAAMGCVRASPCNDSLETLHLKACDLVRRTLLLLSKLEARPAP